MVGGLIEHVYTINIMVGGLIEHVYTINIMVGVTLLRHSLATVLVVV